VEVITILANICHSYICRNSIFPLLLLIYCTCQTNCHTRLKFCQNIHSGNISKVNNKNKQIQSYMYVLHFIRKLAHNSICITHIHANFSLGIKIPFSASWATLTIGWKLCPLYNKFSKFPTDKEHIITL